LVKPSESDDEETSSDIFDFDCLKGGTAEVTPSFRLRLSIFYKFALAILLGCIIGDFTLLLLLSSSPLLASNSCLIKLRDLVFLIESRGVTGVELWGLKLTWP
jgi:hypothetical protein